MGFMVSFASIWCMSRTSPTIYSLTGSLNKVRGSRNGVEGGVRRKCAGGQEWSGGWCTAKVCGAAGMEWRVVYGESVWAGRVEWSPVSSVR